MTATPSITYRIDSQDRIVQVEGDWDRFALENKGEALHSSHILNKPLWDFIQDPTTRELYRQIIARIRAGHIARFEFRCDSPECRRELVMHIHSGEENYIEFLVETLAEKPRTAVALLEADHPRSGELLRVCSWCKKINMEGNWLEIEEAMERFPLFNEAALPSITHGICEDCYLKMTRTLQEMKDTQ